MEKIYSDLDLNFLKNEKYGVNILTNEEAIKQQIKNLVLISANKFLFNESNLKGSEIYHYLFEPLNLYIAINIKHKIETMLKNNIDRVKFIKVECELSYDEEAYILNIFFTPSNSNNINSMQLLLKQIR